MIKAPRFITPLLVLLLLASLLTSCSPQREGFVTALEANPETLDPLRGTDASSERLRQLMFNSLVSKDERLDYTGELASNIQQAPDGLSVTFTLHENVTFHDGRPLTSADAKYTLDTLLASDSRKAVPFFEGTGATKKPFVAAVETPDARTVIIRLHKPWLELLANLVPQPVIPQGTADSQKDKPVGSGPFKFVRYDESQQIVDLEAYDKYWEGAPNIKALRVRAILDGNTLQAELRSGRVTLVPYSTNLSPDAYKSLGQDPALKVEQFPGANIVYLGFNTQSEPLKDARVRQAIAYAVEREAIVRDLLLGQARVAHSILPEESWAYAPGKQYSYDPEQAKRLLDEANFRDPDGDGPSMRFDKPLVLKISASNVIARGYGGVIQNSLKAIGVPLEIETLERNALLDQIRSGQYQMTIGNWVGGNQDPIFLRDLFTNLTGGNFNRSRYRTPEVERILQEAVNTTDRAKAKTLYTEAQEIISRDVPMFPLWYPANMVVARRNVANIKVDVSGDWSFLRNVTIQEQ